MALTQIGTMRCPVGTILSVNGPDTARVVVFKNATNRCAKTGCTVSTDDDRPGMLLVECPDHGQVDAAPQYWQSEVTP